jgi:hypothetical protein
LFVCLSVCQRSIIIIDAFVFDVAENDQMWSVDLEAGVGTLCEVRKSLAYGMRVSWLVAGDISNEQRPEKYWLAEHKN